MKCEMCEIDRADEVSTNPWIVLRHDPEDDMALYFCSQYCALACIQESLREFVSASNT